MNWRQFIADMYVAAPSQPGIASRPAYHLAASALDIADAESRLNAKLPASLESLLLETNGVMNMMAIDDGEWFEEHWLIWALAEVVAQNHSYRNESQKAVYSRNFERVLFFAGAGCDGILFGFPVMQDQVCAPNVVVWHPIEDELQNISPSLDEFLRKSMMGTLWV